MDVKQFWKSKTLWGILIAVLPTICKLLGIPLPAVEAIEEILVMLGGTLAAYGRVSASSKLGLK